MHLLYGYSYTIHFKTSENSERFFFYVIKSLTKFSGWNCVSEDGLFYGFETVAFSSIVDRCNLLFEIISIYVQIARNLDKREFGTFLNQDYNSSVFDSNLGEN